MNTRIINATIFNGNIVEEDASIGIANGKFTTDLSLTFDTVIDFEQDWLLPGFIDLQLYGGNGILFSDSPSVEALKSMYSYSLSGGATSILPTVATNSKEVIFKAIEAVKSYRRLGLPGILGLHLEGPFINPVKKGAHLESFISKPTIAFAKQITEVAEGVVTMITLAPECCPDEVIEHFIGEGIALSAGHSNATITEARHGFNKGIRLVTHLFNAMSPLGHREPGLPGATLLSKNVMSSIVPDGYHVSFDMIKLAKQLMGSRLFIITDAVTNTNGIYPHRLHEDKYILPDGTLSGSALTMLKAVTNCIYKAGIPAEEVFRMATQYPAEAIVMNDKIGSIKESIAADCIRLDADLSLKLVIKNGVLQDNGDQASNANL